ncbi:hypothetical protein HYALB_00007326 [Hymenoscyphus albidus]|uniref:N-acetyltransferase domain-containing protein n=1 Tax=Hymenoscyphus albidus TaxID=595503 RepID=A0A9N9LBI3_9HELO|nr:hypothetical protein HYALB_00007326 [Hymenoscyphus albidus]
MAPEHVREQLDLDLRGAGVGANQFNLASSIADRMNVVPGFKTSAAFFTFLRANLVLPESSLHLDSNYSTPTLSPYCSQTLPPVYTLPPSSLSIVSTAPTSLMSHSRSSSSSSSTSTKSKRTRTPPPNPLDDIPPLTTTILTSDSDKTAALKLIADSIAQQRQFAARCIIFHPLTISIYILLLGITSKLLYTPQNGFAVVATTCAGITMTFLIAIRGLTSQYLVYAEQTTWSFLQNPNTGEPDLVLGSHFGSTLIGALVLRLERNPSSPTTKKRGGGNKSKNGGQGIIRAWTVGLRYRGKGVGTELLEEAVRISRERMGISAEVGFAREHANGRLVAPEMFNGGFRGREKRAARCLERMVGETRKR